MWNMYVCELGVQKFADGRCLQTAMHMPGASMSMQRAYIQ